MSDQSDLDDEQTKSATESDSEDSQAKTAIESDLEDHEKTATESDLEDGQSKTVSESDLEEDHEKTATESDLGDAQAKTATESDSEDDHEKASTDSDLEEVLVKIRDGHLGRELCNTPVGSDIEEDLQPKTPANDNNKGDENLTVYDFTVKDINGNNVSLNRYRGHVLLIVNVASECALTERNYMELEELHERFAYSRGLRILAFPCDQFGINEPESRQELTNFVKNQKTSFDTFGLVDVNGDNAHPIWKFLQNKLSGNFGKLGKPIKWNYTKFIIDKNGEPVERHGPMTNPFKLIKNLQKYLD